MINCAFVLSIMRACRIVAVNEFILKLEFATVQKLGPGQSIAMKALHTTTAVGGGVGVAAAGIESFRHCKC